MQDDDAMDEIKYRLLLVKQNEDDPLAEAYLLEKLKDSFEKNDVKMSDKVRSYIKKEAKKIHSELDKRLKEKKAEYKKLTDSKKPVEEEKPSIFTGSRFD